MALKKLKTNSIYLKHVNRGFSGSSIIMNMIYQVLKTSNGGFNMEDWSIGSIGMCYPKTVTSR